jgi:aspartyl-tRNA(Asn)/glutamyl-tRNA(Gln) amidotransferase subunit B
MTDYMPTIGLEIHAELKTRTKMFCGSLNDPHDSDPNTHVCPVCLAHPGTLPVINKEAVEHVIKVGLAVGGSLATFTEFDRKNYFYPDIPKGYQISQYKYPLVQGGELAGVKLTRIHLEEDTARSQHDQGEGSLVDYNRAGVPLMELVTEPVIHDAETAGNFARELQLLLRTINVSDANMEMGEMRVEANISVSRDATLGTKVEVKNLNSFRAVEAAIKYEIERQIDVLERQGGKIMQETRGWDDQKGLTFGQRSKETAEDYRYFPDPDLPKLDISRMAELSKEVLLSDMPELPNEKRGRYGDLGISKDQIEIIVGDVMLSRFFDAVVAGGNIGKDGTRLAANYLTSDVQALLIANPGKTLDNAEPLYFAELLSLVENKKITSRVAKDLLREVIFDKKSPAALVSERGLTQESSSEALLPIIQNILAEHEKVVAEYKAGKTASIQFLVGQAMKETRGAANPESLRELFEQELQK